MTDRFDHADSCPTYRPGGNEAAHRPPQIITHLAIALSRHVRELRHDCVPVPGEIEELTIFLVHYVRSRQEPTALDDLLRVADDAPVADRLLVTKREAAERLGVSERTIDRLVAAGRLPLIHVERAARLRVSDLESYVRGLAENGSRHSDSGES